MKKNVYKMMNWADIEEVIYAEASHPKKILGPSVRGMSTLVQCFFPGADSVAVIWKDAEGKKQNTLLEVADEDGYFAGLIPTKKIGLYQYLVKSSDGEKLLYDPYAFGQISDSDAIAAFEAGSSYKRFLGAKVTVVNGISGVLFTAWAPNAIRVSVVGEFNNYDGRIHQMEKLGDYGVFELFIPGLSAGCEYKFELKVRNHSFVKADPFALEIKDDMVTAVVSNVDDNVDFDNIKKAKTSKKVTDSKNQPLSIYQVRLSDKLDDSDIINLVSDVKAMGFTHVLLGNVLAACQECNQMHSFYAVNPSLGGWTKVAMLAEAFKKAGVKVLIDFDASGFAQNSPLNTFDETCLFEHADPRQGIGMDNKKLFNYGRGEVKTFLISSALMLLKLSGADGLCLRNIASMLYLDYGKVDGQWVANIYGGNENLESISFLQTLTESIRKAIPEVLLVGEDSSARLGLTDPVAQGGLGFDYKWNEGFASELCEYVAVDPLFRAGSSDKLTTSFVYSYVDKFILPMYANLNGEYKLNTYVGDNEEALAAKRFAESFMMVHPGKKLYASGCNSAMVKELNSIYKNEPALFAMDDVADGFEWLNGMVAQKGYISFVRKTDDPEDMLVIVGNVQGCEIDAQIGVPYEGKYKEIFNSDSEKFGGSGICSKTVKRATDIQADGRAQSISVKLAPQSLAIYHFIAYTEDELSKVIEERIRRNTPIKKTKKA